MRDRLIKLFSDLREMAPVLRTDEDPTKIFIEKLEKLELKVRDRLGAGEAVRKANLAVWVYMSPNDENRNFLILNAGNKNWKYLSSDIRDGENFEALPGFLGHVDKNDPEKSNYEDGKMILPQYADGIVVLRPIEVMYPTYHPDFLRSIFKSIDGDLLIRLMPTNFNVNEHKQLNQQADSHKYMDEYEMALSYALRML